MIIKLVKFSMASHVIDSGHDAIDWSYLLQTTKVLRFPFNPISLT